MTPKPVSILATLVLTFTACGGTADVDVPTSPTPAETTAQTPPIDASTTTEPNTNEDVLSGGGIDLTAVRNDIDCTPDGLGDEPDIRTVVAHYVVEGNLGAVCFGEEDPILIANWKVLADIVPGGQLHDLIVFTGYDFGSEADDVTLAFVSAYDEDGSVFQLSVNLAESQADPDESRLTMLHEFAHVFTGLVTQIDRFAEPDECDTYWNGEGCFYEDSLIFMWIEDFWPDHIEQLDPNDPPSVGAGEERCNIDPSFLGAYAASDPEEDFAETFSAYVLRLTPDTPEQQEKFDWIDSFPGLREFRDRAVEAGYGPQDNNFDICG